VENIASNTVTQKCGGEFQRCEEEYLEAKNKTVMVNRYIVKKTK
jgi:predicted acetyltransferase